MSIYEAVIEVIDATICSYLDDMQGDDIDTGDLAENIVISLQDAGIDIPGED